MRINYVLGGGISGLLSAYYLGWPIITKQVGGQHNSSVPLGPRFLHKTPETAKLLSDLDFDAKERTVRVGYYYENQLSDKCPAQKIREYYLKTRGVQTDTVPHYVMTDKQSKFKVFDIDISSIVDVLTENVEIKYDEITAIHSQIQMLESSSDIYAYRYLVSTVPLPDFARMIKPVAPTIDVDYRQILYSLARSKDPEIWENDYDYIYFPELDVPFARVTKLTQPHCVYEYVYDKNLSPLFFDYSMLPESKSVSNTVQKYGKITAGDGFEDLKKFVQVFFVGRYAEWNADLRIEDVLKKVWRIVKQFGEEIV
jgi:hypothetical protein